ncbi:hypothetical protein Bca4012_089861 [Brassica carinata]
MAPIGSRCRGLSRACFFSRTVASGRGFGLSWTQAELRLMTLITDRERLKLNRKLKHRSEIVTVRNPFRCQRKGKRMSPRVKRLKGSQTYGGQEGHQNTDRA